MRRKVVGILSALMLVVGLVLVMTPLARVSAATQSQTFTASGTFVVPVRVTKITVAAWGGGGAGGGSTNAGFLTARGGAGGGGGAYASSTLTVVPGQTLQVVVGAGGTGVSGANGNAGAPHLSGPIQILLMHLFVVQAVQAEWEIQVVAARQEVRVGQ